jgi:hypothetical protein
MPSLVPRRSQGLARLNDFADAELTKARLDGAVGTTRIQGGFVAASAAMHGAMSLSHAADMAFKVSPMGEDVYRSIVMAYGVFAVSEIQRLGLHD